jgi:hypothetical protein
MRRQLLHQNKEYRVLQHDIEQVLFLGEFF